MNLLYWDLQQSDNPMNGRSLNSESGIAELFGSFGERRPFLFELRANNSFTLTIGFGGDYGTVQYSSSDGSPPYLMALADDVMGQ